MDLPPDDPTEPVREKARAPEPSQPNALKRRMAFFYLLSPTEIMAAAEEAAVVYRTPTPISLYGDKIAGIIRNHAKLLNPHPDGLREAVDRLGNDAYTCEHVTESVHYYGTDKMQLAEDIRLVLAHLELADHNYAELEKDHDEKLKKYNELLNAVARKFEGETRHETALRYIRQSEVVQLESKPVDHFVTENANRPPNPNNFAHPEDYTRAQRQWQEAHGPTPFRNVGSTGEAPGSLL